MNLTSGLHIFGGATIECIFVRVSFSVWMFCFNLDISPWFGPNDEKRSVEFLDRKWKRGREVYFGVLDEVYIFL